MSIGLIGVSPVPVNGSGNFWSTGATNNEITISADKLKVPKFYPGTVITFSHYNTYFLSTSFYASGATAVDDIAVNSSFLFNTDDLNTTFVPYIGSNPNYTYTAPDIVNNSSSITSAVPAIVYPTSSITPLTVSQDNVVADFSPNGNSGTNAQRFYLSNSLNNAQLLNSSWEMNLIEGTNLVVYNNKTSSYLYNGAISDGDEALLRITNTAARVEIGGVVVGTPITRTVSVTTTGGTLGTVGTYATNGSNSIDTTGLAAGIYTITCEYTHEVGTQSFNFEIINAQLDNSPTVGTCWEPGEALNFSVPTGTITAITSLTAGITGTTGGLGTANATFTLSYTLSNLSSAVIRVTTNTGATQNFTVPICLMLPPITNTSDNPSITTDDAANLPPSSIYQCVGVSVDAKGPTFPSGDITWSILDNTNTPVVSGVTITGQNTAEINFSLDDTVPPGNYTLKAVETATPANVSTHSFTLLALPPITVGSSQPYVGGNTQFNTAFPFPVNWNPAEVDNDTGLATWTTAGVKTIEYVPTTVACSQTLSYTVYEVITVEEYDEVNCVYINSGETLALTVTGGSGTYTYAISGQNSINSSGLITAGIYAGSYVVTITDTAANIIKSIPICIGSQSQFCTAVVDTTCETAASEVDPCCELSVNCGESVPLSVPSFHLRINGMQEEVSYSSYGSGTTGPSGYLRSTSAATYAAGNAVVCSEPESLFEIITNLDMSDTANAPFAIGFSQVPASGGVATIDIAVVWHTVLGLRYVEIRKEGVLVVGSTFSIAQGDVVSAGYQDGKFVLYINNLLKFETSDFQCCGTQYLDVAIEQANKSIGGYIGGLTWTIVTPGTVAEVGTINALGVYNSPSNTTYSLIEAEATVGNGKFRVRIRNIKPTVKYTRPDAFLAGKSVTLWVGPYIPNMTETIRIAKDGSPDAIQNPGMIDTGTLEGSANFQEQMDYQDFENDLGQIYNTSIIKESAQLSGTFLEVRDIYKLSKLKPEATLHSKNRGVTEMSVGGKSCEVRELRVIMVIGSPGCDTVYDVLYLPRVQNKGNLGLEVGKKTNGKYELTFTALPDYTLPPGRQLYRLFQYDSCQSDVCS